MNLASSACSYVPYSLIHPSLLPSSVFHLFVLKYENQKYIQYFQVCLHQDCLQHSYFSRFICISPSYMHFLIIRHYFCLWLVTLWYLSLLSTKHCKWKYIKMFSILPPMYKQKEAKLWNWKQRLLGSISSSMRKPGLSRIGLLSYLSFPFRRRNQHPSCSPIPGHYLAPRIYVRELYNTTCPGAWE